MQRGLNPFRHGSWVISLAILDRVAVFKILRVDFAEEDLYFIL